MNLILSPHFDDAVLSLGGLLAKEGAETVVATIFAGAPTIPVSTRWDKKCGFSDSTQAMNVRAEEDRRALMSLNVSGQMIRNRGHLEAEYRAHTSVGSSLSETLKRDVRSLIDEFSSQPLIIYAPYLELHPDHKLVKDAALAAAGERATLRFYQDVPYVFKAKKTGGIFNIFRRRLTVRAIPMSEADMEKKLAAVALYQSQVSHLGPNLLETIKLFGAKQARELHVDATYCEVSYYARQTDA